jgi:hypothetical protein
MRMHFGCSQCTLNFSFAQVDDFVPVIHKLLQQEIRVNLVGNNNLIETLTDACIVFAHVSLWGLTSTMSNQQKKVAECRSTQTYRVSDY